MKAEKKGRIEQKSDGELAAMAELGEIIRLAEILESGDAEEREQAIEDIHEGPIEICVRCNYWVTPGDPLTPDAFMLLLSTGGPATRIVGKLDADGEPYSMRLEYQDWGSGWQSLPLSVAGHNAIVDYVGQFRFVA